MIFEGDVESDAIRYDFSILDRYVLFDNLGNPKPVSLFCCKPISFTFLLDIVEFLQVSLLG